MLSLVKIIIIILSLITSNSLVKLEKKPFRNPITDPQIEDFYTLLGMTIINLCLYGIALYLERRFGEKKQENEKINVDEIHKEEQPTNDIEN